MSPGPSVTIVIPSYNQREYLEEAVRSVLGQDWPVELIVMDGGSTDGSVEVLQRYDERIAYWQSQPDAGQSWAIRDGFRRATGDVLGWLNSDDALCPGALRAVGQAFAADPDAQWVYGHSLTIDARSHLLLHRPSVPIRSDDLFNLHLYLPQESTLFRRSAYLAAGEVDPDLHYAMDYDLWLRLAKLGPPRLVDAYVGKFRVVAGQKSSDVGGYVAEEAEVKRRHADAFTLYPPAVRVARMSWIRGVRMWGRLREDGPRAMGTHAVRVLRGGQVSPGSTRSTVVWAVAIPVVLGTLGLAAWRRREQPRG